METFIRADSCLTHMSTFSASLLALSSSSRAIFNLLSCSCTENVLTSDSMSSFFPQLWLSRSDLETPFPRLFLRSSFAGMKEKQQISLGGGDTGSIR